MSKKILILNWRDPKSPMEGGAERFTQKYAEYWSSLGYEITWVTNHFSGSVDQETVNGVSYVRIGPKLTGKLFNYLVSYPLYLIKMILWAKKFIKVNQVDIVIDEIHGFPFFTPIFSSTKNVLLVCEVAGAIWDKMFPFPFNIIGKKLEKFIYSFYKNTEIWSISENTKQNILELLPKAKVKVIDLGVELEETYIKKLAQEPKFEFPSAVFLARLVKMKGIEVAINAAYQITQKLPSFKLFVMGSGDDGYVGFLKDKVKKLRIEKNVEFLGHLDGSKKFKYLARAHFFIHPSYKEGFGLTLIESGLVGTPAIIRSGSSMDALVTDGVDGFSFEDEDHIADIFFKNYQSRRYANLAKQARKKAKRYLWDDVLERSQAITGIK